jgi:hypothetical protein
MMKYMCVNTHQYCCPTTTAGGVHMGATTGVFARNSKAHLMQGSERPSQKAILSQKGPGRLFIFQVSLQSFWLSCMDLAWTLADA